MAKRVIVKELSSYVPRHIRLGIPSNVEPVFVGFHDVVETIPVLDENKRVASTFDSHKLVEPKDTIGKFKASDFDIDMLQGAGVPLDIVNINPSSSRTLGDIAVAVSKLQNLEEYASVVKKQQDELNQFFNPTPKSE